MASKASPKRSRPPFPQTRVQTCIVHLIRHWLRYVPRREREKVARDLKPIYTATDPDEAALALEVIDRDAEQIGSRTARHEVAMQDRRAGTRRPATAVRRARHLADAWWSQKRAILRRGRSRVGPDTIDGTAQDLDAADHGRLLNAAISSDRRPQAIGEGSPVRR